MNPRTMLARAVSGANLAADPRHGAVDVIAALGAVQQDGAGLEIVRAALDVRANQAVPASLDRLPGLLVRARWCGDGIAAASASGLVSVLVRWAARHDGWDGCDHEQLRALAGVLFEDVIGAEACQDCSGRGLRFDAVGRYQGVCPSCGGSGHRASTTVTHRAKELGVSRQTYYRTWAPRFDSLRDVLLQCERRLLGRARKKLGSDCENACTSATAGV